MEDLPTTDGYFAQEKKSKHGNHYKIYSPVRANAYSKGSFVNIVANDLDKFISELLDIDNFPNTNSVNLYLSCKDAKLSIKKAEKHKFLIMRINSKAAKEIEKKCLVKEIILLEGMPKYRKIETLNALQNIFKNIENFCDLSQFSENTFKLLRKQSSLKVVTLTNQYFVKHDCIRFYELPNLVQFSLSTTTRISKSVEHVMFKALKSYCPALRNFYYEQQFSVDDLNFIDSIHVKGKLKNFISVSKENFADLLNLNFEQTRLNITQTLKGKFNKTFCRLVFTLFMKYIDMEAIDLDWKFFKQDQEANRVIKYMTNISHYNVPYRRVEKPDFILPSNNKYFKP